MSALVPCSRQLRRPGQCRLAEPGIAKWQDNGGFDRWPCHRGWHGNGHDHGHCDDRIRRYRRCNGQRRRNGRRWGERPVAGAPPAAVARRAVRRPGARLPRVRRPRVSQPRGRPPGTRQPVVRQPGDGGWANKRLLRRRHGRARPRPAGRRHRPPPRRGPRRVGRPELQPILLV